MKIRVYKKGKTELVGEYNVRNVYDSRFYHRNMPTLSVKRCREILDSVSPYFKIESELFVIENAETGYTGIQYIYRNGTILNF